MKFQQSRRQLVRGLAAAPMLGGPLATAWAQEGRMPLAEFFRPANISQARLSPDGKSVLAVRPHKGRQNLWVFDMASKRWKIITDFSDSDVSEPLWISDNRMVFSVFDTTRGSGDQFGSGGLFAIDKDAADFKELTERGFLTGGDRLLPPGTSYHSKGVGSAPDEILVSVWSSGGTASNTFGSNIFRLNTRTGRSTIMTLGGPGRVVGWIFDAKGTPRVAVSIDEKSVTRMHYRAGADAAWAVIAEASFDDPAAISPLAFDGDSHLYVLTRVNSDFAGVYRYDIAARKVLPDPVVAIKGYDLTPDMQGGLPSAPGDPLIFGTGDKAGKLIGVRYNAERRGVYWIDEERRAIQEKLEQGFPGRLVGFQGDPAKKDQPLLVATSADAEPTRYLLVTPGRSMADSLGSAMPWVRPERMATTETFTYKARDGLSIPATLTIPRGAEKKNLPLVVLHYGGPWVRAINWGFDRNVQFLASRGYAVLMPAPRASTGFGWNHFKAGWKQWGLAMQDDVADGVRHLIAQGVVDAKRVCISGASYGGYMTMMGLVKEPELYRCGINWVGVTDPELMYVEWTDFARGTSREVVLPVFLGHPKTDADLFAKTSPVKRASEIKQPVLMAYGGLDRRVPIVNGEKMRDALKSHNPNVEYVVYGDEGHGFLRLENQLDFWGRVERFLAKNLG